MRKSLCFTLTRYSKSGPAVVRSWLFMVFSIDSLLCLEANRCRRVLTGESGKNHPKRLCAGQCDLQHTFQICIFFIPNALRLVQCHTLWHILLLKLLCICSYLSQQNYFRPEPQYFINNSQGIVLN